MLTVTREKCLLGRGAHFAPGMYSGAGRLHRARRDDRGGGSPRDAGGGGRRLGRVVYHASQPWPFPYSLMIGCFGEALNEDIVRDEAELEDCRWFSRDEVLARRWPRAMKAAFSCRPSGAIAHHLIRFWAENP